MNVKICFTDEALKIYFPVGGILLCEIVKRIQEEKAFFQFFRASSIIRVATLSFS